MTQLDIIIAWFLLIFAFRIGANLALTRLSFVQLLLICSAIKFLEVAYTSQEFMDKLDLLQRVIELDPEEVETD